MSKLEDMLRYVSEHNDFYKNRIKEYGIKDPLDITQWPVLTRKELQENRYNMFSDGYKSKYFYKQLRRQSSSGSTGIPVSVYWDDKDYYASVCVIWKKRLQYYGIHPSDRQVVFGLDATPNNDDDICYTNSPNNVLNIDINSIHKNDKYEKMLHMINDFKPKWLYVRPFILHRLISSYERFNLTPPSTIKYIESIAEVLTPELKQKAIDLFNVPVVNMYGSEEMNGIAYEYYYDKMHILDENVFVECMDNNGNIIRNGEGEAIITNLYNKAMPLIRYNQGDEVILNTMPNISCSHGGTSQIVSFIKGRTLDSISINSDFTINSIIFLEIMSEVNNLYNSILTCYRFVYHKSIRECICYLELEESRIRWYPSVVRTIIEVFEKRIPSVLGITLKVLLTKDIGSFNRKHRIFEII